MDDLRQKLRAFVIDNFLFGRVNENLSDEDSLVENGVIDSTGVLQLVSFLEDDCGVHVEDDEIVPDNLDSLNKINAFASRKLMLGRRDSEGWGEQTALAACEGVSQ